MYFGHHFWGMHLFWWVFWAAVVVLLFTALGIRSPARRDSAEDTLRKRYAAGEITEDEYRHRLEVLRSSDPDVGAAA